MDVVVGVDDVVGGEVVLEVVGYGVEDVLGDEVVDVVEVGVLES